MSSILIRLYSPRDRESCIGIFRSNIPRFFTAAEEADFSGWLDELDGAVPTGGGEAHYFVAEVDGSVQGCGGWGIRIGADHATLIWGAVHRDHHRAGVGDALTRYRLDHFRRTQPDLELTIDTSQHTAPFYERYGFRTERITNDAYAKGLHRYDMRLGHGQSDPR